MLRNYLKITWRNLSKQRFYAGINILGLAIGVACCLLISLYVWDELSYDSYNEKADRIYRVTSDINFGGKRTAYAVAQAPLAKTLREEVPEVETSCRFRNWGSFLVRREGHTQNFKEERVTWADHEVFDVFTIPIVDGDPKTVLKEPGTLMLSESTAYKYFKTENPIGQTLILNDDDPFKVVGVYKDIPANSHFHYDILLGMEGLEESKSQVWLSHNFITYAVATPGTDPKIIEGKIEKLFKKYGGPQVKQFTGATIEEIESHGEGAWYTLMPLRRIHLHSNLVAEHEPNSDVAYVWIFSAIALFILAIACINFMNLATARSANRAKEVGMRKVLGSLRKDLIGQFLTEAIAMSAIAFIVSLVLSRIAMPYFNQLTGKKLDLPLGSPGFIAALAIGMLLTGLLAGSYPAFYLSAFQPMSVLKGRLKMGARSGWLRNGLVVFQFAISLILIIGTGVIYRQLNFIQNKRLGFNKDQVLILDDTYVLRDKFKAFKNSLEAMPEVKSATSTCYLPVNTSCRDEETLYPEGKSPDDSSVSLQNWWVDYDYLKTLGMEMKEGRFFSRDFGSDSTAMILNEAAVKKFGFEQPIGQRIVKYVNNELTETSTFTVIGVVKDFHFQSLRSNIDALCMYLNDNATGMMSIRFDPSTGTSGVVEKVRKNWESVAGDQPMDFTFLDDRFRDMYHSEQRLGTIFIVFAGLAVFIACLGLLALAAFTAERRTKEIGIRKVLGATTSNIIVLLTTEFTRWVLVASLVAIPLAYLGARKWLQHFAYQTQLSWWIFAIALGVAILVAILTVSFQAIKAAVSNPVESLRAE